MTTHSIRIVDLDRCEKALGQLEALSESRGWDRGFDAFWAEFADLLLPRDPDTIRVFVDAKGHVVGVSTPALTQGRCIPEDGTAGKSDLRDLIELTFADLRRDVRALRDQGHGPLSLGMVFLSRGLAAVVAVLWDGACRRLSKLARFVQQLIHES